MNAIAKRQNELKPFFADVKKQIESLLQDAKKAERFMAAAMVIASDQSLIACTPDSIVKSLVDVAQLDLNIDKNIGHCYLLPYNDYKNNRTTCQLQVSYKGFIQLMFRAGWMVKYEEVYRCDRFTIVSDGWKKSVEVIPDFDQRDDEDNSWVIENLRGIYVEARHISGHTAQEFVSKNVINKMRLNSPNQKLGKYTKPADKLRLDAGLPVGIWNDWFAEMAIAKAIKRVAKRLPIGDVAVLSALRDDDAIESTAVINDDDMVVDAEVTPLELALDYIKTADTLQRLKGVDSTGLAEDEKETLRAAYAARHKELSIVTTQLPQTWAERIIGAGDKATLDAIIAEMDDIELFDHQAMIDENMDRFR